MHPRVKKRPFQTANLRLQARNETILDSGIDWCRKKLARGAGPKLIVVRHCSERASHAACRHTFTATSIEIVTSRQHQQKDYIVNLGTAMPI
jgi:hypothetical protein